MAEIVTANTNEFVMINSTISDGKFVYPGQTIKATCTTRGSNVLAWQSSEYLGFGNQLSFVSSSPQGTNLSHGAVVVTLVSVHQIDDQKVIESTITIKVSDSDKATSSIICRNVDHDESANVTVHKSGKIAQY